MDVEIQPTAEFAARLARDAAWSAERRDIEADLRSDLATILVPFAEDELGLPREAIRQEGTGRAGRFDSLFGTAIIEYKRPRLLRLATERASAASQALGYLDDPELGARVVIVTDGETWGILRDIEAGPEVGEQLILDLRSGEERIIPPISRFSWRPTSVETATAVLELIGSQRATSVTSASLRAFMGPGRAEVLDLLSSLSSSLANRAPDSRKDVLLTQWIRTAGVAYGISSEGDPWPPRQPRDRVLPQSLAGALAGRSFAESVFLLHTYVAIAAKLVAAEVLAIQKQRPDLRPSQWRMLPAGELSRQLLALEDGTLSDQLGAPGLLASDLFDWYAHAAATEDDLRDNIRGLLGQLNQLAWAAIANAGGLKIDLLRDLYQDVVPRGLRKALGEFFTPRWLCEYVFAQAMAALEASGRYNEPQIPNTLDPSCGSGTFLVAAVRTALQNLDVQELGNDPASLEAIANRVTGIDINPVSALMARVNLLLAFGDRAQALPEVRFRVYQADAIVLPRVELRQLELGEQGQFATVSTAVEDFRIPSIAMTAQRIGLVREALEAGLRNRTEPRVILAGLEARLLASGCSQAEFDDARAGFEALITTLGGLRDADKDDVWARVIEQSLAPFLLPESDLVIGNPPWISWKNLPDAWKSRSEPVWRSWGLWQRRTGRQGIPLSDISVLLVARALSSYAPHGLVAMLLPQSVQLADPGGNAFRRSHLRPAEGDTATEPTNIPYRLVGLDDFVPVNPFAPDAANQTIAAYLLPGEEPAFPAPLRQWRRQPRARIVAEWNWRRVEPLLELTLAEVAPVDPDNIESPWGVVPAAGALPLAPAEYVPPYNFGRGFETRGLDGYFLYRILRGAPTAERPEIRVVNLPDEGDNTRNEAAREGVVEAALFWPLVKGEDVHRWTVANSGRYILVPYRLDGQRRRLLSQETLAAAYPRLSGYLQPWIARFAARSMYRERAHPDAPWALSGPVEHLSSTSALVFIRYLAEGGMPAAAVRSPEFDTSLGRNTLPLPNNKSNIYYTDNEDEAHYIAAFVNSQPAQRALGRFAVATGVTPAALRRLPLPRYDDSKATHRRLAELGRNAHDLANDPMAVPMALTAVEAEVDAQVPLVAADVLGTDG